jgi:hypothetical protein
MGAHKEATTEARDEVNLPKVPSGLLEITEARDSSSASRQQKRNRSDTMDSLGRKGKTRRE